MYYVNKIVGWVLSPMGILFLGLGAAWAARVVGSKFKAQGSRFKVHWWIVGLTLAFTWLMGCGIMIRLIGVPLEVDEIDLMTLPKADAIVLLGGGMGAHAKCGRPEMFASADRVWAAAQLWKEQVKRRKEKGESEDVPLFVTGTNNIATTSGLLADLGVPTNVLRSVNGARNTEEEARGIVGLLDCSDCLIAETPRHSTSTPHACPSRPKVLLVTSAWHMKRAKMMFEKYAPGLEVIAAPADYEMHGATEGPIDFGDFLPNAEALARNSYALKEWIARIGYALLR